MSELITKAKAFAIACHEGIGHRRKYTNEPYWIHPQAVAEMVASVTTDPEIIAAAWLHDTVEDTSTTLTEIEERFGRRVAELVSDLTDVSTPADGNRAQRKSLDREHSASAHADAKTVKLADLIHNTDSIVQHAPGFAKVYLEEKRQLLEVLKEGDSLLYQRALMQLQHATKLLSNESN